MGVALDYSTTKPLTDEDRLGVKSVWVFPGYSMHQYQVKAIITLEKNWSVSVVTLTTGAAVCFSFNHEYDLFVALSQSF